jgi:hypothetical protein
MEHVAILNKSWGLLPKIVSREKTIESRWLLRKTIPFGKVSTGDTIYFKNSGEPVSVEARVKNVLLFDNLNPDKVNKLLIRYGNKLGINSNQNYIYFNKFKDKKYCILIELTDVQSVKPFDINKKGFGAMSAWICVENINKIII